MNDPSVVISIWINGQTDIIWIYISLIVIAREDNHFIVTFGYTAK